MRSTRHHHCMSNRIPMSSHSSRQIRPPDCSRRCRAGVRLCARARVCVRACVRACVRTHVCECICVCERPTPRVGRAAIPISVGALGCIMITCQGRSSDLCDHERVSHSIRGSNGICECRALVSQMICESVVIEPEVRKGGMQRIKAVSTFHQTVYSSRFTRSELLCPCSSFYLLQFS